MTVDSRADRRRVVELQEVKIRAKKNIDNKRIEICFEKGSWRKIRWEQIVE